jgi:uncharacterized protein (DUF305 family)
MKTKNYRILFTCLAMTLFIGPLQTRADAPAPWMSQAAYEVRFLTGMIDHHAMAVMMTSLCEGRAVHDEFLALCEQITSAQSQEISVMQDWLQDWYGLAYEPEMNRGG